MQFFAPDLLLAKSGFGELKKNFPERETEVILEVFPLELLAPCKACTVWAGSGNIRFGHVLVAIRQGQRRDAAATGEEQLGRFAARKSKYIRLFSIVSSSSSRRRTCDEFLSMAVALRRALQH
jgi:hypothetical protein